jgi:hypothetical protein
MNELPDKLSKAYVLVLTDKIPEDIVSATFGSKHYLLNIQKDENTVWSYHFNKIDKAYEILSKNANKDKNGVKMYDHVSESSSCHLFKMNEFKEFLSE